MRRTRRGPKVVWLPPDTTFNATNTALNSCGIVNFILDAGSADGSGIGLGEIPLVVDATPDSTTASLSDIENSGYRLRRIVGKIFVALVVPNPTGPGQQRVCVTAGIIVRRTTSAGEVSAAAAFDPDTAMPCREENWTDPWIWRRSWLLSQREPDIDTFAIDNGEVATNYAHGPAAVDGPHVDQKTARIISQEERLFLSVSATGIVGSGLKNAVRVVTDLRVLGTMRTSSGNRRNATR